MPIYEYECEECAHQLEALQKFSDEPLKKCPECGKDSLKKVVSQTSFQLKGSGWYVTDIRDKDKPKPKATEKSEGGADTTSDTSKDKSTGTDSSNPKTE